MSTDSPFHIILTLIGTQEFGGYISDITRTWPANGKFTDAQRDLYTAVLNVQRSCVSLCRESAGYSLDQLHKLGFDVSGDVRTTSA